MHIVDDIVAELEDSESSKSILQAALGSHKEKYHHHCSFEALTRLHRESAR